MATFQEITDLLAVAASKISQMRSSMNFFYSMIWTPLKILINDFPYDDYVWVNLNEMDAIKTYK